MSKKSGPGRLKSLLGMLKLPGVRKDWLIAGVAGLVLGILATQFFGWCFGGGSAGGWFGPDVQFTQREVNNARHATRRATDALERFLGQGHRADGWRAYLHLNALQYQLQSPAPPKHEDIESLSKIHELFSRDHNGLELDEFANVRRNLATYLKMVKLAEEPQEAQQPPTDVAGQWRSIRYR